MKKFYCYFSRFMVFALMFVANFAASTTCWISHYQPEVPESLRK